MFNPNEGTLALSDGDAVLLDAAGTLIEPVERVGVTYAAVAGQFGTALDPELLARAFGEVFRGMPPMAFNAGSIDELKRLERDWWRTLVMKVVSLTGSTLDEFDGYFNRLYAHYSEGHAWRLYPEVEAVLRGLRARGCKLAVVSNFDSRLPGILSALGIAERFDTIVYSTAVGSAKPDAGIFRHALAVLGVAAERAVHVGDSLDADYRGASGAGLAGLLIKREGPVSGTPSYQISSLDVLLTWGDR